MAGTETWLGSDGLPLEFQDGDYVRVDLSVAKPTTVYDLPFLEGYVRGFDISTVDGVDSVAYYLFKVGHNLMGAVREEVLKIAKSPYGSVHDRGGHEQVALRFHAGKRDCGLCGWIYYR